MRITVNLEPKAERLLSEVMRKREYGFRDALNQAVIRGLSDLLNEIEDNSFVPQSYPMRLRADYDPRHLNSLSNDLEVEAFIHLTEHPD